MNIRKLAKLTGYSVSTVSKAFSGKKDISEYARSVIFEKAKELGCYDKYAKDKYDKKIIAVLCPETQSQFYSKILSTLNVLIEEYGGTMATSLTDFSVEKARDLIKLYSGNKRVDGIIYFGTDPTLTSISLPLVAFTSLPSSYNDTVHLDVSQGINQAVQLLKQYGHNRIAFLGESKTKIKELAFINALNKNRLVVDETLIIEDNENRFEQAGFEGMNKLLKLKNRPTAVFSAYDNIALGAIQAIEKQGLKVPEDISVIGCDDMGIASHYKIGLSTINLNINEGCKIAVEMLFNKINNPFYKTIKNVNIVSSLKDRKTIGPAKQ